MPRERAVQRARELRTEGATLKAIAYEVGRSETVVGKWLVNVPKGGVLPRCVTRARCGSYTVQITVDGYTHYVGRFQTVESALIARNIAQEELEKAREEERQFLVQMLRAIRESLYEDLNEAALAARGDTGTVASRDGSAANPSHDRVQLRLCPPCGQPSQTIRANGSVSRCNPAFGRNTRDAAAASEGAGAQRGGPHGEPSDQRGASGPVRGGSRRVAARYWDGDLDDALLPLWKAGLTADAIAASMSERFGCEITRGAVLGRVNRHQKLGTLNTRRAA